MNSFAQRKVLVFGALGAAGCLLGWALGEGLLAAGLPTRTADAAPSLARPEPPRPEPPALDRREAPRPEAPTIAKRDAPKPIAPDPAAPTSPKRNAPPPLPPEIQKRLDAAGGKSGQLQFTLVWNNRNDLDLHCVDPTGEEIFYSNKKAKGSGGHLDVDRNVKGETITPVENIYFPDGAPLGRYRVLVNHFSTKGDPDPTTFTLSSLVEDRRFSFDDKLSKDAAKKLIHEFDLPGLRIAVSAEVSVYPGGTNKFRVKLERDKRNNAPVRLTFAGAVGAPADAKAGLTLPAEVEIPGDRSEADVEVVADPTARTERRNLRVIAAGKYGTVEAPFQIVLTPMPPSLHLAAPAEVVLFPGGKNPIPVRLTRFNNDEPVRLTLTGDAAGLTLPAEVVVPAAKSEAELDVAALRTAAAGTRALKLVATGKHGTVEEPLRVTVQIPPAVLQLSAPKSVSVQATGDNRFTVLVARDWYTGPVRITATPTAIGVVIPEATIPADRDSAELTIAATAEAPLGTFPVALTATGGPAKAEAKVSAEITEAPPPPPPAPASWSWRTVLVIGLWTALLAAGLSLALVAGQNRYLGRPWWSGRPAGILAGGALAGLVAGGIGQALFSLLASGGVMPEVGFLAGWLLLGGLLGRGVGFFIPNLHPWRSALAGAVGGLLGALAFILISKLHDVPGRLVGAALLGGCIGLMVALVEVAFRTAWLEVHYSASEIVTVNLGPNPVKIGGSNACTIWARGAPALALRFWVRDGKVVCEDAVNHTTREVTNGSRHRAGTLEVIVRTGTGETAEPPVPKVERPPRLASGEDEDPFPLPMPADTRPPRPASNEDDYDPLPMPVSPPPAPAPKPAAPKPAGSGAKPPVPKAVACPQCKKKLAPGKRSCPACGASW